MRPDADRPGRAHPGRSLGEDNACADGGAVARHRTEAPRQLGRLDEYLKTERLTILGQFLNELGTDPEANAFHCPRCQRTASEQIVHAPAAVATSPMEWKCSACGRVGNRWNVVGAIRARSSARARVLAHLDAEEVRRV